MDVFCEERSLNFVKNCFVNMNFNLHISIYCMVKMFFFLDNFSKVFRIYNGNPYTDEIPYRTRTKTIIFPLMEKKIEVIRASNGDHHDSVTTTI